MDGIIREPTEAEKRDFTPIGNKTMIDDFNEELGKQGQIAAKKGLPFCERAAKDDFYNGYREQAQKSLKQNGFVRREDIKEVKMDWAKYSDLKNFEKIEEGEEPDDNLTRRHPGLRILIKKVTYKFKGYVNKYVVMDDETSAINRARKHIKDLEK